LATSVVSAAELYYGAAKSVRGDLERSRVDSFLASVLLVGLTVEAARIFGGLKADFEAAGQRLADADLFIAAIALTHRATLVTGNRRHFDRVPGLAIENWLADGP